MKNKIFLIILALSLSLIQFVDFVSAEESGADNKEIVAGENKDELPQDSEESVQKTEPETTNEIEEIKTDTSQENSQESTSPSKDSTTESSSEPSVPLNESTTSPQQSLNTPEKTPPAQSDNKKIKSLSNKQILNTAKPRKLNLTRNIGEQKSKHSWNRNIELGINTAKGNSDILRYNTSLSLTKGDDKNYYWLKMSGYFGKSNGIKDTDNTLYNGKYECNLNENIYASCDAELYHDSISDLSYRNRYNISLGSYVMATEGNNFQMEAGPGYLQEKKGDEINNFLAFRIGYYWELLLNSNVIFRHSAEYIVNAESPEVYYLNLDFGMETYLRNNLSLKIDIKNRYDNTPILDKKNNDLITTTSLSWHF